MFLKKKKDELTDQLAVYQERGTPRWGMPLAEIDAGITIAGYEGEGQLGNISISGCSMMSVTYVNMTPDEIYSVRILPGKEYNIQPFTIKMRLNWVKSSETVFLAGFSLEKGNSNSYLEKYIEVLRSRGLKPDYGNMSPGKREI